MTNVNTSLRRGAVALLIPVLCGCNSPAPPAGPPSPPVSTQPGVTAPGVSASGELPPGSSGGVSSVAVPPPDQRGPVERVVGEVTWVTGHPGCAELEVASGQRFGLAGDAVQQHSSNAAAGHEPAVARARLTGYVAARQASVCGASRVFVAEKVEPMN